MLFDNFTGKYNAKTSTCSSLGRCFYTGGCFSMLLIVYLVIFSYSCRSVPLLSAFVHRARRVRSVNSASTVSYTTSLLLNSFYKIKSWSFKIKRRDTTNREIEWKKWRRQLILSLWMIFVSPIFAVVCHFTINDLISFLFLKEEITTVNLPTLGQIVLVES